MPASIYPITVRKKSVRASSVTGGKDFHLVLVVLKDGRALFITRFARKGQWGTINVERFDSADRALKAWDLKHRQKLDRDYSELLADSEVLCGDEPRFRLGLGDQYWFQIGAVNLKWISPGLDVKGVKTPKAIPEATLPGTGIPRMPEEIAVIEEAAAKAKEEDERLTAARRADRERNLAVKAAARAAEEEIEKATAQRAREEEARAAQSNPMWGAF